MTSTNATRCVSGFRKSANAESCKKLKRECGGGERKRVLCYTFEDAGVRDCNARCKKVKCRLTRHFLAGCSTYEFQMAVRALGQSIYNQAVRPVSRVSTNHLACPAAAMPEAPRLPCGICLPAAARWQRCQLEFHYGSRRVRRRACPQNEGLMVYRWHAV